MDEMDRILKKSLGFKPNTNFMSPESITYLHNLKENREMSKWISQACEMMHDYEHYKKGFLLRMIEHNFSLCKHILRQVGRSMKE